MHYRTAGGTFAIGKSSSLGFVDKVFLLLDRDASEPLGIVVYGHAPLELSLRNHATGGRYVRNAELLNREVRILRRLVIHPDVRGCGLGALLVRRTLPLVGTRYVECLAALGSLHPVFERAGMTRIGLAGKSSYTRQVLQRLDHLGLRPEDPGLERAIAQRPQVRELVVQAVTAWYRATTGAGRRRAAARTNRGLAESFRVMAGTAPVYYLWQRSVELSRPSHDTGTQTVRAPLPITVAEPSAGCIG